MSEKFLEWLQSREEAELYPIVRDLLITMNYKHVTITHGSIEIGRDLVFMEDDNLGRRLWRAIQVKAKPLTGNLTSPNSLRLVINQCEAALGEPFIAPNGERARIHEIWLVSTHPLNEHAKLSAATALAQNPRIHILDSPQLLSLFAKYLPELMDTGLQPIETYLQALIDLCDSLEDYIHTQLHRRFSLKSVFVPPVLELWIAPERTINEASPLAEEIGLALLSEEIDRMVILAQAGLLPAADSVFAANALSQTYRLLQTMQALRWSPSQAEGARMNLLALVAALKCEVQESGWDKILPDTSPAARLEIRDLEGVESSLLKELTPTNLLEPVKAWRRFQKQRKGKNQDDLWRRRESQLRNARDLCLKSIETAYRLSTNAAEEWTRIAKTASFHIKQRITGQVDPNFLSSAVDNLNQLMDTIASFDSWFRKTYRSAYAPFGVHSPSTRRLLPESDLCNAGVLAKYSALAQSYYAIEAEDGIRINSDAMTLLEKFPKVLLKGDLGLGKTTLLKRYSLQSSQQRLEEPLEPLPVLCALGALSDLGGGSMKAAVAATAKSKFKSLQLVATDSMLWLLDGYDEIRSESIRSHLLDWCSSHQDGPSRAVVTSRPHAFPNFFPDFVPARLLPMSREMIVELVRGYFKDEPGKGIALLAVLDGSSELFELAMNPLLATLIIILAKRMGSEQLPRRRERVYELILRLLLGEWDTAKGVERHHCIEEVDTRFILLRKTAYEMYAKRRRALTKIEFINVIIRARVGINLNPMIASGLFGELLRDCLIVPISPTTFGYFHFSMQEYLAAAEMASEVFPKKVTEAIREYFASNGTWWEEALVFYAGIKRDVAPLVNELHRLVTGRVYEQKSLVVRLLKRWFAVADCTEAETLSPRGLTAQAMEELNIFGRRDQWESLARLPV